MKTMISVIVCHHKGDLIYKCLKSIKASRNAEFEIIVITSSEDPNHQHFKNAHRTVWQEGGPAIKRNVGIKYAQGNLIAFFDDDVEIDPWCLYEMQKSMEDTTVGMSFGKLLNAERRQTFDEAGSYLTFSGFLYARAESGIEDKAQFERIESCLAGKSASCMIRRKVFHQVEGFDVSYEILGEETDLAWRVWLYGYKVMYSPKSVAYHAFNTRFKPLDFYLPKRVYFNGCRNYISMLLTNLEIKNLGIPILCQVFAWITCGIGMFITRKPEAGLNIFKGLFYVLRNLRAILVKRRLVQSHRKISDKELFKFIMKNPPLSYYTNRFKRYIQLGLHG